MKKIWSFLFYYLVQKRRWWKKLLYEISELSSFTIDGHTRKLLRNTAHGFYISAFTRVALL